MVAVCIEVMCTQKQSTIAVMVVVTIEAEVEAEVEPLSIGNSYYSVTRHGSSYSDGECLLTSVDGVVCISVNSSRSGSSG